jgi:sec-independent protein translocase protein TatB
MFDISWTEFLLIGVVALIVIGPKELPAVMRTVGQWTRKIRNMAADFQRQFEREMREAELADLKKQVDDVEQSVKSYDPLKGVRSDVDAIGKDLEASLEQKNAEAKTAENKNAEPKNAEPKNAEPKNAEPKNAEPKNAEPKNAEPKNAEPKEAETPPAVTAAPASTEPAAAAPPEPAPQPAEVASREPIREKEFVAAAVAAIGPVTPQAVEEAQPAQPGDSTRPTA